MAQEGLKSTTRFAPAPRSSLAKRASDYFGMSGPAEFLVAVLLFGVLVLSNIFSVLHQNFDSDEPQHLHVIWGWTRGLVQYRELFDNHMPLFHIVFAPILGVIGECATVLFWMRFILLPMYFVSAWSAYKIGTRLFSRRAGIWAVITVGFYSGYYFSSFEFRTDNLWIPIWLLCVALLVRGAMSVHRALVAGLLMGFCLAVSLKATVSLLSVLVSTALAVSLVGREKFGKSWLHFFQYLAVLVGAAALVPGIIMIFFALKGVWPDFRYCVFDFNFLAYTFGKEQVVYKSHTALTIIILAILSPVVIYSARWIVRGSGDPHLAIRRAFVFLVCSSYLIALGMFWVSISRSYRAIDPLVFVLFSGALLALSDRLAHQWQDVFRILRLIPLPAFVALAEVAFLQGAQPGDRDHGGIEPVLLRSVLRLTGPEDYVLDCKGETVFRRRCFQPILEWITIKAIARGLITDDAPQRCIETHTCVVATVIMQRFSEGTLQFIERNYLPVTETLRVAGAVLHPSVKDSRRFDFEVVIPASYKIISRDQNVSGTLDGTPYHCGRFLAAGPHTFESTSTSHNLILLWTQAVDRHFTPFEHN
jgi:hypothetical protein